MKVLANAGDVLALDAPGIGLRFECDGVVVVQDLTEVAPAAIAVPALFASHRATTSSRRPGRVNYGTVYTAKACIEPCVHCGRLRRAFPGVHAPLVTTAGAFDCVGRPCERDAKGYYRTIEGEA